MAKETDADRKLKQRTENLNQGMPTHRGPDDATRKAVRRGLENRQQDQHRKQRELRRHAPKNSAAHKASPEEHPDDEKRLPPKEYPDGHNSETAEKVK